LISLWPQKCSRGRIADNYDVAILVAGDGDYVPLVRAVKGEGARVHVWAFSSGLSPKLKMEADHFVALDQFFSL
jgi:uncharacterized LabA/DUF88 family protein